MGRSLLWTACNNNNAKVAVELINAGADVNEVDEVIVDYNKYIITCCINFSDSL